MRSDLLLLTPLHVQMAPCTDTFIKRMARLGLNFHLAVFPPPGALFVTPWGLTSKAGVLGPLRDPYGPDLRDPSREGLLWGGDPSWPNGLTWGPLVVPPLGVRLTYHSGVGRWAVSAWPRKDAPMGRRDRHACFPSKGFMPQPVESLREQLRPLRDPYGPDLRDDFRRT